MRRHACALLPVTVCLLISAATAYAECARVLWRLDTYPHAFRPDWFEYHYNPQGATATQRACDDWKTRIERQAEKERKEQSAGKGSGLSMLPRHRGPARAEGEVSRDPGRAG